MILLLLSSGAFCQTPAASPLVIDLPQALARARQYGGQVQAANLALAQATQDRVQAHAATLPQVNAATGYLYTEGNGTPSGVFVANNGVHVYTGQGVVHEDVLPLLAHGQQLRAAAAEAVALARVEVARRGLNAVVIQNFYGILDAERKRTNAATAVTEASHFVDITRQLEGGGEAAHADVVKAQTQLQQRQVERNEAEITLNKAKIALAVLIMPDVATDFSVKDDLDQVEVVPALGEARNQATTGNPDVKAAEAMINQTGADVSVARYGYLPTIGLDFFYGLNSSVVGFYDHDHNQNVGAAAEISVNIPVWNWGATKSKVKQAQLRQDQARLDLSLTQRTLQANIAAAHAEADGALSQVSLLRDGVTYSTESLRLTLLRYQAGEATAFEVADAQTTLKQARDAYDDGLARYRIALASLRALMGTL
ncbi:MAG TPA: TolC family protein [Bryobacteraceae bacterium]